MQPLIRPFSGLRPTGQFAAQVAAPPYDVLTSQEARARAGNAPWSFLHISKAEIDLPSDCDPYSPAVYDKAADNMAKFLDAGVLRRDAVPCYYVYRLRAGEHTQTGIVAAGSVEAYRGNRIRRHELTRPAKENDRVRQIEAVGAQTGPVLVAHPASADVDAVVTRVTAGVPVADVTLDNVDHTIWVVSRDAEVERITRAFEAMEAIYIADGHHRSAAAARVAEARSKGEADFGPDPLHNYFLVVSFPISEVNILPYNRVVRDLHGLSPSAFLEALKGEFVVEASDKPVQPARPSEFGVYLDGGWHRIALRREPETGASPAERLDVSLLSERLLAPILGIGDPRTDPRIDFVGGIRGLGELERRVDGGDWAVAFSFFATAMDDLVAVADAGQIMPPKSTWFEPKLADGLVSLVLE
ncbi:MAG: DUF1015 domain-containing protein [Sphingomonadales bacterium]